MNEVVKVPFYDDLLEAVQDPDGSVWVSVKRICENLGVSGVSDQIDKLRSRSWATNRQCLSVGMDGKNREMFLLALKSVPMWLATIDENRVKEEIKSKLVIYQAEAAEVLAKHFFKESQPTKPLSPAEQLLASAKLLVEHEARIAAVEEQARKHKEEIAMAEAAAKAASEKVDQIATTTTTVKAVVDVIIEEKILAKNELAKMPEAMVTVAERPAASLVKTLVDNYHYATNLPHKDIYRAIYREVDARYHINIGLCLANAVRRGRKRISKLQLLEEKGYLPQVYAVAKELLAIGPDGKPHNYLLSVPDSSETFHDEQVN